jgi:flagellar basal-body rod protein FlgC
MVTISSTTPDPTPMPVRPPADGISRPMFRILGIAATGLSAQRARMEVAAQNIANAETTRTPQGGPYRRKTVTLEEAAPEPGAAMDVSAIARSVTADAPFGGAAAALIPSIASTEPSSSGGVQIAGIGEDHSEGALVYDPGHPDANANGYVRMPNVQITDEMMDMMDARRVYDANASVFQAAKAMLRRALDL